MDKIKDTSKITLRTPVRFGPHKIPLEPYGGYYDVQIHRREMLYRALNSRALVAFLGAGCSFPLGYPSWKEFGLRMIAHATKMVTEAIAEAKDAATVRDTRTLDRLKDRIAVQPEASDLVYALSTVQKIFRLNNRQDEYHNILYNLFANPATGTTGGENPYHSLLELPILRFITSNYDCELERALVEKRDLQETQLILPGAPRRATSDSKLALRSMRSFTQRDHSQLAEFVLAGIESVTNTVFHCHGYYVDPSSLVVSEQDYREQYLGSSDSTSLAFQQTLALLFGSNPILFVGYGLSDDDLLRPLRMFIATDKSRRRSRSLFALQPLWLGDDEESQQDRFDYLYERYGINIVSFDCEGSRKEHNPTQFASDLCKALTVIKSDWKAWWTDWLKKPPMRKVPIPSADKRAYSHYILEQPPLTLAQSWIEQNRRKLIAKIQAHREYPALAGRTDTIAENTGLVLVLTGVGGTGKSWLAADLLHQLEAQFADSFFWSSYYVDDSVSGIDRALAFLESRSKDQELLRSPEYLSSSRFSKLHLHLKTGKHMLVFDGIERFLLETDNPGDGEVCSPTIHRFLETVCSPESNSLVLLTSRLWPIVFDHANLKGQVLRFPIPGVSSAQLTDYPFSFIRPEEKISEICALLDGHIYALALLAGLLSAVGEGRADADKHKAINDEVDKVLYALSRTPPDRRTSRMIRESFGAIGTLEVFARNFLEIVSIFASPIKMGTLKICWGVATQQLAHEIVPELDTEDGKKLLERLWEMRLLQKVEEPDDRLEKAYTMHPMAREYFFRRYHHSDVGAVPNLTLPGFTAATANSQAISEKNAVALCSTFDALKFGALAALKGEALTDLDRKQARRLCRGLFGIVRSRMGVLAVPSIPGWEGYDKYALCLAELVDITRKISPNNRWRFAESGGAHYEMLDGPLYADELAWLYNEIGLVSYAQGNMIDALATWDQAYTINQVIDGSYEDGHYIVQSFCNLGAANIEYGNLRLAEQYLRNGLRASRSLEDTDHQGRLLGYLALIHLLRGNFPEAGAYYRDALKLVRQKNPRAEAVFLLHYAHLKFKMEKPESAERDIRKARAIAEAEQYLDLVAYARVSEGHMLRIRKNYSESLLEYQAGLHEARRIGIRKLEANTLSELARLALDVGDAEVARQRAIASLDIANELGLGLRKTHGLVVLGLATLKAGQRELGVAYLKHSRRLADQQGYWLRMREAEEELYKLGELEAITRI